MFGKKDKQADLTRVFFATDVHGSDQTFMKFLNAAKLYKVQIAILGGDITGKVVVPIVEQPDGSYRTSFMGQVQSVLPNAVSELEKAIILNGLYPYRTNEEQLKALNSERSKIDELFTELVIERLKRWCQLAEERLKPAGIKLYVTGGNDDMYAIEPVLKSSSFIIDPESDVLKLDEDHEMISTGYSNLTPWKCPRDISEEKLEAVIETMTSRVTNMSNCVFNIHVPPFNSDLDTCAKLDTSSYPPKPIPGETISAGSTAVRRAIEKYQPLLGLHGHIHESRGASRIGRTLCLNPGSEYSEGILRGVVVTLGKDGIKAHQFTSG